MSTRWRVIDLTSFTGDIETGRGRLIIDGEQVPLADVNCILTGTGTRWGGAVVDLCSKHDVMMLACDWKGTPISATLPWTSHTRVAARQHAQANLTQPRKKNAWMRIIKAKITGQATNLDHAPDVRDKLRTYAASVRSGDTDNLEARAARSYWSALFPGEKFTRDPDLPGRNSLLNYGYTILRGTMLRAISEAGLSPTLGIFHHHRSNPFGLVDDLMEPFRPAVDAIVTGHTAWATLDEPDVKRSLVAVLSTTFLSDGSTTQTAMTDLARAFAQYVEGETPTLSVPTWIPSRG